MHADWQALHSPRQLHISLISTLSPLKALNLCTFYNREHIYSQIIFILGTFIKIKVQIGW